MVKRSTPRFAHLEKLSLNLIKLVVVCNPGQSVPSWGEGHSRKLTFVFRLKQVNIQLFHLPKFQPSKCPLSKRNSSWKIDFRGRHFETVLAERPCLCDFIRFRSKLAGMWKTCNYLDILNKVSKIYFFQVIFQFTVQSNDVRILRFFGD